MGGSKNMHHTTVKTVLDNVVVNMLGQATIEELLCEIDCNVRGGEPRTHDYPGSSPEVEIVDVRFLVDDEWRILDDPESIEVLIPDVAELALFQVTSELLGRFDSEMDDRLERERDGD